MLNIVLEEYFPEWILVSDVTLNALSSGAAESLIGQGRFRDMC
jgi:hypothetical protein